MNRLGACGCYLLGLLIVANMAGSARAMTERELMDFYLASVEEAVDVFEPLWVEGDVPGAGHFDFRGYKNWMSDGYVSLVTTPGNGQVIFCYALLLNETNKQTFGKNNIPREVIRDHALKAIRWTVMTSGYVPGHVNYPIPGLGRGSTRDGGFARKINQSYDSHGLFTLGAAMLWDQIDQDVKDKMEYLFKGSAQPKREPGYWGTFSGGHPDRVKQNLSATIGAAWLLKDAKEMAKYREFVAGNAISAVGTEHDYATSTTAEGRPISRWATDWNLYPDYSSDHHWWAQIWYGCDEVFEGFNFMQVMARTMHTPIPQTATWPGNGYGGVLGWAKAIVTPEGEPASPHGMEYDSYYGSGLLAYAYGATIEKDPVSAALEQQAALLLRKHNHAVPQYDHHRDSWAKPALAYLIHKYEGPGAEPMPLADAMASLRGTYHFKWQNNLVQRSDDKFVSFAWGAMLIAPGRPEYRFPRGWVMPARNWEAGMEPLVYMHPQTLFGKMTVKIGDKRTSVAVATTSYNEWRDDQSFNTTGEATDDWLARRGAFHSFERGPSIWLLSVEALRPMQLDWTGMPIHFYARDGMTQSRTYTDAQGSAPLEQAAQRKSQWWSVGDRLGIATLGLGESIDIHREPGFNWARSDEYKDTVDVVSIGGFEGRLLKAGETLDSATVIYPGATADQIAAAQAGLEGLDLPEGWRGVVAPDAIRPGIRHMAVTRLHGEEDIAALNLSYKIGAPVLSIPTLIEGNTAHVNVALDAMHSLTESFDMYLKSNRLVSARRVALGKYHIEPLDKSAKLEFCFPDSLAGVSVKWVGAGADPILITKHSENPARFKLSINGPGTFELAGGRYKDDVAPAVEIAGFNNREDGRVKLTIDAADRSGIESIEMLRDGKSISTLRSQPWEFYEWPGTGLHTWQAIATDKAGNKRESVKRTFEVRIAGIGME